jgi:hypothetical protein
MLRPKVGSYLCLALLLALNVGCTAKPRQARTEAPPPQDEASREASARMKQAWAGEVSKLDKYSRNYSAERIDVLSKLLDEAPDAQVAREVEQLLADPTTVKMLPEYEHTLLEALVVRGVKRRDRQMLTRLLSIKCPRYVNLDAVELYLALSDLTDPLLILFESYRKAANEEARQTLRDAVSQVSDLPRADFGDDSAYVSAVEAWYVKNKDDLEVNPSYSPRSRFDSRLKLFKQR